MAQRVVEMLIGRLIADESFRQTFLAEPEATLLEFCERGAELTPTEIAALINTHSGLWAAAARRLDPRLQKISLERASRSRKERKNHV